MTDFEKMVTALLNGESVDLEPNCRCEEYLKACIEGKGTDSLPTPRSRMDILLWQLAEKASGGWGGGDTDDSSWEITWDGNTEGLEVMPIELTPGFPLYRVVDTVPDNCIKSVVAGERAMLTIRSIDSAHSVSDPIPEWIPMNGPDDNPVMYLTGMGSGPLMAAVVPTTFTNGDFTIPSGVYMLYMANDGAYTSRLGSIAIDRTPVHNLLVRTITEVYDEGITELYDYAFKYCFRLTSVRLPFCTRVGIQAFYNCQSLTTIEVPYPFKTVRESEFYRCFELVNIPSMTQVTSIAEGAFEECRSITTVPLTSKVTVIPNRAFNDCYKLENIGTPVITSVGQWAFADCKCLVNIDLTNVTHIGPGAFQGCLGFTEITLPNLTTLGYSAFSSSTNLVTVSMPKITDLANATFHSCSSLRNVDLPSVTNVQEYAFYKCTSLGEIDLTNVTAIAQHAFDGCNMLFTAIAMPNATTIGTAAFQYCSNLRSILDAPKLTKVDSYAFFSCPCITSANVPELKTIGYLAFYHCGFSTFDAPKVTSIGYNAFQLCDSLTALILRSETVVTTGMEPLKSTPIADGTGYIYVPAALVETYKTANHWSAYANQFRALEDYTVDGTITGELDESKVGTI